MAKATQELTIIKTLFLKAPPEHVWKFLTKSNLLALWFHEAKADLGPGSDYVLVTNTLGKEGEKICWGAVEEFDPPKRLVHTFTHDHLGGTLTRVAWQLTPVDGGTILRLDHTGFEKAAGDAFDIAADHDKGWDEHFIRLRRVTQ